MGIVIQQGVAGDLDEVAELYGALCDALARGINYSFWSRDRYPTAQTARDWLEQDALYVLRADGRITASIALPWGQPEGYSRAAWSMQVPDNQILCLHTVATHPDFHGHGYAGQLVQFAVGLARERSAGALRLDVCDYNTPAIRVYERAGFCCVSKYDLFGRPAPYHLYRLYEYPL